MMQRLLKFNSRGPLRRAGDQGGFTMVEALVGVAIIAMVATVMAAGVAMAFRAVHFQRSGGIAVDEGRRLMPQITPDLQVATGTNLGVGVPLSLTDDDLVLTHVDLLGSGGPLTIAYSLDGTNLLRTQGSNSRTVARHVTNATFLLENTLSGPVYTITVVTAGEDTDQSQAINEWVVYQRTDP